MRFDYLTCSKNKNKKTCKKKKSTDCAIIHGAEEEKTLNLQPSSSHQRLVDPSQHTTSMQPYQEQEDSLSTIRYSSPLQKTPRRL